MLCADKFALRMVRGSLHYENDTPPVVLPIPHPKEILVRFLQGRSLSSGSNDGSFVS